MSKWLKKISNSKRSKLRVFCFPFAGGSAAIFNGWSDQFPSDVDILAIQAPGRGERFSESPIGCLRTKVRTLADEIAPYLDVPYILLGHSNGALTAFELARTLQKSEAGERLRHVVISAKRAPHLVRLRRNIAMLPHDEFVAELKSYSGTPPEILQNREFMELFLPMLRADFLLSESYELTDMTPLKAKGTLLWGTLDGDVSKDDMLAWSELFQQPVNFVEVQGGHFFVNEQREFVIQQLVNIVMQEKQLLPA